MRNFRQLTIPGRCHPLWEGLVGRPDADVLIVDGPRQTQHARRRIAGVVVHAASGQVALAAGFEVDPDHN